MKKVIIIDNHDSFSWNLAQLFAENASCVVEVKSIDEVSLSELELYDKIVISPGPDVPSKYPKIGEILQEYYSRKSILGVCLGHQSIVEFFSGKLVNLDEVYHGIREEIEINNKHYLFSGLNDTIKVGLYHSWAADADTLPECLDIIAKSKIGIIMGVSHREYDIIGIQFHPESYMTEHGNVMIENWIKR